MQMKFFLGGIRLKLRKTFNQFTPEAEAFNSTTESTTPRAAEILENSMRQIRLWVCVKPCLAFSFHVSPVSRELATEKTGHLPRLPCKQGPALPLSEVDLHTGQEEVKDRSSILWPGVLFCSCWSSFFPPT